MIVVTFVLFRPFQFPFFISLLVLLLSLTKSLLTIIQCGADHGSITEKKRIAKNKFRKEVV